MSIYNIVFNNNENKIQYNNIKAIRSILISRNYYYYIKKRLYL
jgi:hypothetical protein